MADIAKVIREQLAHVFAQLASRNPLLIAAALHQAGDLIEAEIEQEIDERIAIHAANQHKA